MRPWREYIWNPVAHQGGISASLGEWFREKLTGLPSTTITIETNCGGLDEAGTFGPDSDWAGLVAIEFPHQTVHVRYLPPEGPGEAGASYFVRLEIEGQGIFRAEAHPRGPGVWVIYEDSAP